jgi:hypothetical protein
MNTHTFQTKLISDTLHLVNISNLIGKEVIVSIIEIPQDKKQNKRKWNFLGAVSSDTQLDQINIRDFAYE